MSGPYYVSPSLRAVMERRQTMHEEARAAPGHTMPRASGLERIEAERVPTVEVPRERRREQAIAWAQESVPVSAIAERLSVSRELVYQWLRGCGVLRPYRRES